MNVFEDLIVELKQENLLEKTVIDKDLASQTEPAAAAGEQDVASITIEDDAASTDIDITDEPQVASTDGIELESLQEASERQAVSEPPPIKVPKGKEFFRKRAIGEVSSLQMVEHVLTAVEREYMKVVPSVFDDFNAKKALNTFLRALESDDRSQHAEAEFALMQETEAWCSALAERDKKIHVASLRRYCENTKPALSSQAMLSIAKFYRNLPYSEGVRAKFDFVITRLFSRPCDDDRRTCLFSREEMLGHINTLYSDWASVPLYSADDDESKIMLTALSFEDLAHEAEHVESFDKLIESDFFGRVRLFKESISEIFLAPEVTAAAIEANVRIGNAYVTLIAQTREKMDAESIESKYGDLDHLGIADATAKTLELVEILKKAPPPPAVPASSPAKPDVAPQSTVASVPTPEQPVEVTVEKADGNPLVKRLLTQFKTINKWVIVFAGFMVAVSIALAVWSNYADEQVSTAGVASVDFGNAQFIEYIKISKMSSGILYVQLQPSWDAISKEKKLEILQKIYQAGPEKGFNQVTLVGKDGKTAGYASASRLEVSMP